MTDEIAPDTIVALEAIRQASWHKDELKKFLKGRPELLTTKHPSMSLRLLWRARFGESPGGIPPQVALRTLHEPVDSHGSRCSPK